jgi:hypothetical protein
MQILDIIGERATYVFELAELHDAYEYRFKNLNVNRTRLKGELLAHFQYSNFS